MIGSIRPVPSVAQSDPVSDRQFINDIRTYARSAFPLFRYLVLQTETHAFCLALACAALIGFYPFCALLLSLMKYQLHWNGGYNVFLEALAAFYPASPSFLTDNLRVTVARSGSHLELGSVFWVFLGAAGVFVPLEAGLNRLWKIHEDRPYWKNQLVGVSLTVVCSLLALAFVAINASAQSVIGFPIDLLSSIWSGFSVIKPVSDRITLHLSAVVFFSLTILLFYKYLPNRKVETMQVLPAAILAGIVAEIVKDVYVMVLPLMDLGSNQGGQGPFYISVSFVILAYFETFVVLGGAFLATQTDTYPWLDFMKKEAIKGTDSGLPS